MKIYVAAVKALRKMESSYVIAGLSWGLILPTLACHLPALFYTQTLSLFLRTFLLGYRQTHFYTQTLSLSAHLFVGLQRDSSRTSCPSNKRMKERKIDEFIPASRAHFRPILQDLKNSIFIYELFLQVDSR